MGYLKKTKEISKAQCLLESEIRSLGSCRA